MRLVPSPVNPKTALVNPGFAHFSPLFRPLSTAQNGSLETAPAGAPKREPRELHKTRFPNLPNPSAHFKQYYPEM